MAEEYGGAYTGAQIDQAVGKMLNFNENDFIGPVGPQGPDGNPIGTIISYMGLTAPKDYLICDGATYNVSDYADLAKFFTTQFGSANYFGGDGTTTFAVPDMRNLFLRGYHGAAAEQLSGEVGAKQEATKIPGLRGGVSQIALYDSGDSNRNPENTDTTTDFSDFHDTISWTKTRQTGYTQYTYYTSRPVNMAVLYCIKARETLSAEGVYSTEEIRIGTWIDGKPLYRRVFTGKTGSKTGISENSHIFDFINVDTIVELTGMIYPYDRGNGVPVPNLQRFSENITQSWMCSIWYTKSKNVIGERHTNPDFNNVDITVIATYTKTTD